jgi:hypothetical protein
MMGSAGAPGLKPDATQADLRALPDAQAVIACR